MLKNFAQVLGKLRSENWNHCLPKPQKMKVVHQSTPAPMNLIDVMINRGLTDSQQPRRLCPRVSYDCVQFWLT